jgi:uncharacterized membrane protein YraQ (UPF0718 family)
LRCHQIFQYLPSILPVFQIIYIFAFFILSLAGGFMSLIRTVQSLRTSSKMMLAVALAFFGALAFWHPDTMLDVTTFVGGGLLEVAPLVIPGILLAGWIMASGAGDLTALLFQGRTGMTVIAASLVGAVLPVCGITVLPLMAGLLAAGVPLAPVMAFWLASPVTDPAMLGATAATLGWEFAAGKTISAVFLGMTGGMIVGVLSHRTWALSPLRSNFIVGALGQKCAPGNSAFDGAIWRDSDRINIFRDQVWSTTRLILIVLIPAFAAEYFLNTWLQPEAVAQYVGSQNFWAIPLAVLVGGPAYIDGFAALPLTRALLENGMSPGAALSFLVAGGVVSIWGALVIAPVLHLKPFLLFLSVAVLGSMVSGWVFEALV